MHVYSVNTGRHMKKLGSQAFMSMGGMTINSGTMVPDEWQGNECTCQKATER